ncbi:hypothetical protein DOTSEDRAFT_55623 [Dothistroma septosporum NZE10]|uniref:PHD-type domain-containing protein n=1 Tax=Dothistroma septosporum (strain NZE10 / CBS 128990) TaxID=675120 RepID=N1PIJ0_DOTSN|nr:hypothetical protein DOTSEDRAFT_55623 [Dothistroma septosporum NZE10]
MEEHHVANAQSEAASEHEVTSQETNSAAPPAFGGDLTEMEELDAQIGASAGERPKITSPEPESASAQTDVHLKRISADAESAAKAGTPGHEPVREYVMRNMTTPTQFADTSQRGNGAMQRGGRGGSGAGFAGNGDVGMTTIDTGNAMSQTTPATGRGRPRGRPPGRPRGSRGRGGGRGGKRKREEDDEGGSDSSDEVTPVATMTKSGRSIQKPTSFVPPPPSPTTNKRRRHYTNRKNPESAVCKVCLRGTSPASNQVVFCDGCNAPYHQWCHKPPISNAVIEEVDKEWFCAECESERVVPVPEAHVASFVSGEGISLEQRQQYFSRLPAGLLVTLLTKATILRPDLPLFSPEFKTKQQASAARSASNGTPSAATPLQPTLSSIRPSAPIKHPDDDNYAPETHPPNYPRPGQGLMSTLPPESEDLKWLVEDEDKHGVFTHVYRKDTTVTPVQSNGTGSAPS